MKNIFSVALGLFVFLFTHAQSDSLSEYVGTYRFPTGSPMESVDISIQNGALFGSTLMGSATLERLSKDTFSIPAHNGIVYFSRSTAKVVVGIHIEVGDVILDGTKDNKSFGKTTKFGVYPSPNSSITFHTARLVSFGDLSSEQIKNERSICN